MEGLATVVCAIPSVLSVDQKKHARFEKPQLRARINWIKRVVEGIIASDPLTGGFFIPRAAKKRGDGSFLHVCGKDGGGKRRNEFRPTMKVGHPYKKLKKSVSDDQILHLWPILLI
jgi:hypothetical protein